MITGMKHSHIIVILGVGLTALLANPSFAQDSVNRIEYSKPIVGIQATPSELIISSQSGIEVIPKEQSKKWISVQSMVGFATASRGRVFATAKSDSNLSIVELSQDAEPSRIVEFPIQDWIRHDLRTNEDGSILWLVRKEEAVAISTRNREVVKTIKIPGLNFDFSVQMAAVGKRLIFAQTDVTKIAAWNLYWGSVDEPEKKRLFDVEMLIVHICVADSGHVIVSGRDELHAAESGFLRCLDAKTLTTRWNNDHILPLGIAAHDHRVVVTEGGNWISSFNVEDGKPTGRLTLGNDKSALLKVAANATTIWALGTDRKTLFEFKSPKWDVKE